MSSRTPDDDDWVGTPPEGRVTRDRADPGYWQQPSAMKTVAFGILGVLIVIVVLLAVL